MILDPTRTQRAQRIHWGSTSSPPEETVSSVSTKKHLCALGVLLVIPTVDMPPPLRASM